MLSINLMAVLFFYSNDTILSISGSYTRLCTFDAFATFLHYLCIGEQRIRSHEGTEGFGGEKV